MMTGIFILSIAVADRFLLKRNAVEINGVTEAHTDKALRFAVSFDVKRAISNGTLSYSLRNKKYPTAVLAFSRPLMVSGAGKSAEFITFSRASLEREAGEPASGQWVLDVKIERSCSRVNPLYKIFPVSTHHSEEFNIE